MTLSRLSLRLAVVTLVLFPHGPAPAVGGSIQIVSPSKYAGREGDGAASTPRPNGRSQQVLPASDFLSLPPGYRYITQMAARPDRSLRRPLTGSSSDNSLYRLSTTAASPPNLSRTFANNIGPDETVVFDGPLALSTDNVGPDRGPKEFDYIITFETPFEYDPNEGNLLVDTQWFGGESSASSVDIVMSPGADTQLIWSDNHTSRTGPLTGGGIVYQFTFVPRLQAGDADQDLDFDQFDLVRVQQAAKYLTGQPATWGEGDWNGVLDGCPGHPSEGDGAFDQFDIVAAQKAAIYRTGPYAGFSATDVAFTAAPEPSAIVLAILGLVGLLPLVWRRGRSV